MSECTATVGEELLAFCRQDETAAEPVEEPEPQLLLKVAELPGKGRLADAQADRGFRDGAQLGDGDEGSQALEVHRGNVCRAGM
ncbi:MAG TPA: hypothetical protein VGF60_03050 [Xanthobacteraceae bacterium]